jgi:polar amino acid transport system permease protein
MPVIQGILNFLLALVTIGNTFNWDYVWTFLFSIYFVQGAIVTVIMAVLAQTAGFIIGLILYFMRRSSQPVLQRFVSGYVWIFRGTPLLVQILFIYALLPHLHLARPLINTHVFSHLGFRQETPFDAFLSALLALALNEGAYMAEIVRAGIDSVDVGQLEAAKSLGMTYGLAMRRVVLPQALRIIIPPLGNEFNSMLKSTSLAYTIGVFELYSVSYTLGNSFGRVLELAVVGAIWYLAMTTIWGFIQSIIERRLNASNIDPSILDREPWWRRVVGAGKAGSSEVALPVTLDRR